MKTLFEQLTPENQALVANFNNIDLTESLNKHKYFHNLDARALFMMVDIFNLNKWDISFSSAAHSISKLFINARD